MPGGKFRHSTRKTLVRLQRSLAGLQPLSDTSQRHFTISYTISGPGSDIETEIYSSAKAFQDTFHRLYTVGAVDPPEAHVDPIVVYIANNPFLIHSSLKKCSHIKVGGKALEDGEGYC